MDPKLIMELDAEAELVDNFKPDMVEVVRCRDCTVERDVHGGCPLLKGLVTPPDFFCANGNREVDGVSVCI